MQRLPMSSSKRTREDNHMTIHVQDWDRLVMIRAVTAAAAVLLAATGGYAGISGTSASVRPDNSLIVDVQVTTDSSPAHVFVTYQAAGVDPLVSRLTQVS